MKAKSDPLRLRAVEDADIAPLAKLWFEGWQLGHAEYAPPDLIALRTLESFENRIRDKLSTTYVTGPMGAPVGFIRIMGTELDQFYVDPSAVGQGLGRQLMLAAEDQLRKMKVLQPHLICAEENDRAAGFYKAMGWRPNGISDVPVETSDGPFPVRVIRFEKTLTP